MTCGIPAYLILRSFASNQGFSLFKIWGLLPAKDLEKGLSLSLTQKESLLAKQSVPFISSESGNPDARLSEVVKSS